MDTHGRAARRGLAASIALGALVLAALTPGLAEGAKKGGKPNPKSATLSVQTPSHAKVGVTYKIGASGYSGSFNRLLIVGSTVNCPANADQAYLTFTAHTQAVQEHQKFNRSEPFRADSRGKRHACVYLFHRDDPAGNQKRKFKPYTVSK